MKLTDLDTCNKLIGKHGAALLGALAELESLDKQKSGQSSANLTKLKAVNERAMLFRITSSAMISVRIHISIDPKNGRPFIIKMQPSSHFSSKAIFG